MCEGPILANSCDHCYCQYCWTAHLDANLSDRNLYEIMPKCQEEECEQKMNYSLIQSLLDSDSKMQQKYNSLLCTVYCRQSKHVKMCSAENCGKIIYINSFSQRVIICLCNNWYCTYCGKPTHFPVECADMKNWNKIENAHQNTWLLAI